MLKMTRTKMAQEDLVHEKRVKSTQKKETQTFLLANEVNTDVTMFVCTKMINLERRIYGAKRLRWGIAVVE